MGRTRIDRSFITDLLRDPDDLALTSAIIAMAHSMGITVVAEGVEKQGQYDLLRDRDCDLVQGFLYSRALSDTDFINWHRQHTLALHTKTSDTSINPKS